MASGIGTIEVKRQRGKLVVQGLGQTPRGQKFIRETKVLKATKITDPGYKAELAAAVKELLSDTP